MSNTYISLITGECRGYAHAFYGLRAYTAFPPPLCPFNCNMRREDRLTYRWTECSQSHVILQIQLLRECFTIHPPPPLLLLLLQTKGPKASSYHLLHFKLMHN